MKIAVIGANGQLGGDIHDALIDAGHEVIPLNHDHIELGDAESIRGAIEKVKPGLVVNTAAMHHVEKCETNPLQAFRINALGSAVLAATCRDAGAVLYHISTDYVFDGRKGEPYLETDCPAPLNVYANTKLAGEHFISATWPRHCILRVSGIYGHRPCRAKGGNFVETMLRLASEREEVRVVDDEFLTPTFTMDIAAQIVAMIEAEAEFGLYHVTAGGDCSWYDFAREIFSLAESNVRLNRAAPGEFAVNVQRPKYSVLENARLQEQNLDRMPHWKDGLKRYLTSRSG